jgi:hypothetical protein
MTHVSLRHAQLPSCNDKQPVFSCPITGYRCERDLSHLCEDPHRRANFGAFTAATWHAYG